MILSVNPFMQQALDLARDAAANGEVPVGAVIVKDDQIIAQASNLTEKQNDPTAHAEMLVIRAACDVLGTKYLTDHDLYVTLEPCPMCAQAISFARIRRLYFGAFDAKGGGVENGPRIFNQTTCHHKPEIYSGMAEQPCSDVLKEFFKDKR